VEYDKKEVRVKNGTVFPVIGGISKPLFKGDFTIPFAEGKSSSFAESGKSSAGFKLGGLDVDFNKIILDKNAINLGASFALPLEIAENPIRVSLTPDSSSILDIPNGLIIDNSGLRLGVAGGVKLPNVPKDFKLFNLIKVSTSDLNISYSNSDDAIKLQGKVQLSPFSRLKTPKTIEADLTKDNFIQIKDGKADFVGSISAKNITLIKGWNLPELKLFLDTTKNIVEGDVNVRFPFGKQPVLFRKSEAQVGIGVGFQNFELNAIRGNLTFPQPGIPIGTTGFFVESLGGGIRNLAPSSEDPIEFTGSVKIVPRLAAGLASFDASATISSEKLSGSGKFEFIARDIVSADVSAELDWNKEKFSAKGDFSFFDGLLKANTGLKLNSNLDFSINGKASATIPKAFRGRKIPLIGGKSLPNISFLVDYKNDSTLSNDFGAIWGSFPISVPGTSIQRDVSVGLKVFFDGDVDVLFGSKLLPETNSFQVAPGSQYIILSSDWENSNPNVKVRIKKPDGSFIDEADFAANNISIFAEFTDEDTRSVVIANPTPGIWDIVVVDPNGLGEIVYSGIADSVAPTIEITSPATEVISNGIVNIGFNAFDSDSTAKVKLFYDDDNTGLDGLLITDSLLENDGAGTFAWNTEGVPTGEYFIYAMIMDDENIPVFSNYSAGKIKVTESADLELNKVVFGNDPITNSNFTYQLSITNKGTSISKDVVLKDSLPAEVTFISASTVPSQQTGSDLTFNIGDIAPGATKTVDIIAKAPATALTLLNNAEVTSKTFDPFIGDNFATLSTNVDVPPTPLTDLSVTANSDSINLKIGNRITYDFVVTNNGTGNATNVIFTTNFTANAGGVQNLSTNVGSINGDVVTANLGSLTPGQSRTVSVFADLTAAGTLTTTADVSGNELDPSTLNNSLILQKNVEAIALVPADLELSLTSDKTTASIDDIVTLRLTLTNKGIGAATSIKVKQVLASGLTFVSSNPQQGTYDSVSGIWDVGNIAKDNRAFIDIVTKVTSGGSLLNTAEIIAVAETDPDSTPNNNNPNEDDQASVTLNADLATPTLIKTADDIFTISGGSGNPKLQVTLTESNSNLLNELAVFTVDDAQGKINGIAPGETGYTQAALNKSKVIFSTIANRPNGFNINNLTSILEFESGNNLRFLLVKNGTIDSVQNGNTPTSDILFSDLSRQKITDLGADGFSLAWKDGSNNNTDFKDLVVNIKSTNDPLPLGTNLQGTQQGEVIDLRDINQDVKVNFVVNREAAFNNFVGFYKVADENGGIDVDADGTVDFRPGDSGYAQAAIKNRVAGIDLTV
ncbi:MAG: Ig-like domain-containing protein, partial [Dolichospermum sp.]